MDNGSDSRSRPWWRRIRLSVRGLIVVVLLIGGGLGWFVRKARIQREAYHVLWNGGCLVWYDWQENQGRQSDGGPWAPQWLVNRLGFEYFGEIVSIDFPEEYHVMRTGKHVYYIGQSGSSTILFDLPISDADLAHLEGLSHLESLRLNRAPIGDTGLEHVAGLANLRELELERTRITDAGLVYLRGLTKLRKLNLRQTAVTDAGVRELQSALPKLEIVR